MLLLLIVLKQSLFYKVSFGLKSLFSFSSWKPQQEVKKKKNSLKECFKYIFLALNCQPSRNETIEPVINPGCKLVKGTPTKVDTSVIGRDDARECLQSQVILKA